MKYLFTTILFFGISTGFSQSNILYKGGNLYQSETFVQKDFYVVDGKFAFKSPKKVDSTILIKNKYIIPPFADAHTHNLDRIWQANTLPKKYIEEGTIYVLNLTSKLKGAKKLRSIFNKKSTIDVAYSHQGLTSTIGHPFKAYEPFEMGLMYKDWAKNEDKIKASRLDENNSYIFLDSKQDLKEKLPNFFAEKPDVVKIFIINSKEYNKNYNNDTMGDNGLSIDIAKIVTKESHKRNLKVFAHIETSYDFVESIKAGVDYFAHMPGYGWNADLATKEKYFISDKVLDLAVKKGVGIIPTLGQAFTSATKDSIRKVEFIKDFLLRFKQKKGKILIGADAFAKTLSGEIQHYIDLNIFTPNELLKILCYDTPRIIFPNRSIGKIEDNYEASFLILDKNPLKDINSIKSIRTVIKQGIILFQK